MSKYTPSTKDVRYAWMHHRATIPIDEGFAEFDRWLSEHDAEVAIKALRPVRAALNCHPRPCTDTPFSCGWKRAVVDARSAIELTP